ncbi:hypothetical protein MMC07_008463 [Pseudocyphellaria aurata]|nr:hypothetical protein [Pseudocyphellaria aurata]
MEDTEDMVDIESSVSSNARISEQASRNWEEILLKLEQWIENQEVNSSLVAFKAALDPLVRHTSLCERNHDKIRPSMEKCDSAQFLALDEFVRDALHDIMTTDWSLEALRSILPRVLALANKASMRQLTLEHTPGLAKKKNP